MNGFDVLHIKSAVKNRSHFKWDRHHLTTSDFGQIMIPFNEEMVPSDDYNQIKANSFARCAPLVKPTYGKCDFKTAAFFVPYHQIAEDADAWINGQMDWQGQSPIQRVVTAGAIMSFLSSHSSVVESVDDADFTVVLSSSTLTIEYHSLDALGRYYLKILNSLGYSLPEKVDWRANSQWRSHGMNVKYSAYPLLAFFKAYNDWMSQSQRFNTSALSSVLLNIRQGKDDSVHGFEAQTGLLNSSCLETLFSSLKLNYDNDYFTSAWQNANTPLQQSSNKVPVIPVTSLGFGQPNLANLTKDFTVVQVQSGATQGKTDISALALQFLKSFDNWVRRNNYAGSRDVQQTYARFGIKTDDYRTHYAHLLKTTSSPLVVGDVTATADSVDVPIGDYAGKAIVSDDTVYSYQSSDHGLFIVLAWMSIKPMNAFGIDRKVMRTSPFDYFTPEFDGIGADPISMDEVFINPKILPSEDSSRGDNVFGFTERYNAYRCGYRDQITGDFRIFADMDVWHFGRDLSLLRKNNQLVAQSDSMNTLPQVNSEYNRIFSVAGSESPDHFYFTFRFDVDCVRPMMNFNEVVGLGVGDTSVPRNGNTLN